MNSGIPGVRRWGAENLPSPGTHAHEGPLCPDPRLSAEATERQQSGKVLPGRIRAGAHSLQMTPQGSGRMGGLSPLSETPHDVTTLWKELIRRADQACSPLSCVLVF